MGAGSSQLSDCRNGASGVGRPVRVQRRPVQRILRDRDRETGAAAQPPPSLSADRVWQPCRRSDRPPGQFARRRWRRDTNHQLGHDRQRQGPGAHDDESSHPSRVSEDPIEPGSVADDAKPQVEHGSKAEIRLAAARSLIDDAAANSSAPNFSGPRFPAEVSSQMPNSGRLAVPMFPPPP